ncbi:putative glucose-induced degradation complex subunit [Clavispora lusitaniae]|uniref:Glucose-induced degradation complex subunit n=1 Tax=Clavispora lusitaniae TaxID=36911 RepID=A0AA91PVY3_CLALS|nr:putative glucose-induced degradation complex subunit [Clavispora lusitaniae]
MSGVDNVYIIPPYLLQTCLGSQTQHQLMKADPVLGERNTISTSGEYYFRQPRFLPSESKTFCNDPLVNDTIKKKLRDKFAALGLLGCTPAETLSDDYLLELYDAFKTRLGMASSELGDIGPKAVDTSLHGSDSSMSDSPAGSGHPKSKKSIFEIPRLGEVVFGSQFCNDSFLENLSFDSLMSWVKDSNEHKYSFFPYLMSGNQNIFLTPFPMYWTPLCVFEDLEYLDNTLGMNISIDDGCSNLDFQLRSESYMHSDSPAKKKFFNFIANKEVEESTGVFYYEVSVEQEATNVTDFKPIIFANDPSISSNSSLLFSMGFTKRNVQVENVSVPTGVATPSSSSFRQIDLKNVQSNISFYKQDVSSKRFDWTTLRFLSLEPGVDFSGSFAVSFNNSCSYSSVKSQESVRRDSAISINRRFSQLNRSSMEDQHTSNIGIEVPLTNHTSTKSATDVCYKTDTLGCGVNFVEKTLFITLNGIHVKTITEKEMTESNTDKDSIFSSDSDNLSLFPMIGFQLFDLPNTLSSGEAPKSRISTNFGLKQFKFNIERYVSTLKEKQKAELASSIIDELQKTTEVDAMPEKSDVAEFENAVCNLKNDASLLNDLIKGYLVQEGFLDTLSAFTTDLDELDRNMSHNFQDVIMEGDSDPSVGYLKESLAVPRKTLRSLIFDHKFIEAAGYLSREFPNLKSGKKYVLELQLLHYVGLLRHYLSLKFDGKKSDANKAATIDQLLMSAIDFGKHFLESSEGSDEFVRTFGELSSVLMIEEQEHISEFPLAKKYIENFSKHGKELVEDVNAAILASLGFHHESKLETMIQGAGHNIAELCSDKDNMFKMVNYERDYIDI